MHSSGVPSTHAPVSVRYSRLSRSSEPSSATCLQVGGVPVRAEVLAAVGLHVGHRRDQAGAGLRVPLEALPGRLPGLLGRGRADRHREGRRLVVHVLADRLGAAGDGLAVDVDLLLHLFGRHADRERAEPEAELADLAVAVVGAGGAPDRRVGLTGSAWAAPDASASTSARPRTRTRRSSSSRRRARSPPATWRGSRRDRSRSPRARHAWTSDRCRGPRGRWR